MIKVSYPWAIRSLQLIKLHHDSNGKLQLTMQFQGSSKVLLAKVQRKNKILRRRGLNYMPILHLHMSPAPTIWNFLNSH